MQDKMTTPLLSGHFSVADTKVDCHTIRSILTLYNPLKFYTQQ
ncbi:hypothetical protein M7I_2776 [Glarea lozoyensis 74030]|uniref:Uncharacterized protein n=1 Tax=Glarea lozoyensis (strain ATCC 74030 / MF5533) TaxID=1104152 RepID=H0EJP6_GLAL7|nr:hypothetical protein M7I_2776 [Glarea lozoyensis 74030]